MSKPNWDLYKIYKADCEDRMSAYLSKSHIPRIMHQDIIHDAIVDAILYNKDPFVICKEKNVKESIYYSKAVSDDFIGCKGFEIVDPIFTGARPDMYTLITAVEMEFIQNYCTDKDIKILIALMKYKTPLEVGRHLGISNVCVSQRILMIKEKYIKYKKGIKIKRYGIIGDKHEIDPSKLTTPIRTAVAELYNNNVSYAKIAEILNTTPRNVACIIYAIRKK